ncbi:uncharacterized protein LOC103397242 [Cynoglossus semilaevis]|uniref:uncharacterized protein LOC103397242 n=1 Tax=Cynoglossus semilaevis TaxID=244447 RepID=UPI00049597F5|nr:uncharacterized protein LOC103397242 [Cynoglossus semilaevis]
MASIDEFFQAPSDHLLTQYTKEQLLKIADNYGVEIGDKRLKENIRTILKTNLVESGILKREEFQAQGTNATLNFEQQKELLKMQLEYEKLKQERELEVQLELEKMKFKTEQTKLELEHYKLNLIKDGKLNECSGRDSVGFSETSSRSDLSTKLKMVPKFNERDPDTFFSLFERVAETCEWLDTERTLLLQCVFTGKAQEAYSALSSTDSKIYVKVKAAVLKAYELVPEAYRQHFRGVRKREQQTHVEFVREMVLQFNRWCSASEVVTFQQLCDLVTLEQFKNCVPDSVATYLNERKVKTPHEAAVLADEYILTHKSTFVDDKVVVQNSGSVRTSKSFLLHGESGSSRFDRGWKKGDPSKNCNYCQRKGHWKNDCPVLKRKSKFLGNAQVKPAALAASAQKKIQIHSSNDLCPVAESNEDDDFSAFISDGYVSLCGEKVPIKILRDTGAKHSFICESVLPFSSYSDTRNFILMRGMGMTMVPVPVHKMELVSGFVTGEVEIGVRPALPVEGIDMILGNDLAGSRVWADDPPYVVTQVPELPRSQTEVVETNEVLSEVEWFPVCAVTRAMGRRKDEAAEQDVAESKVMVVPVPLDSISHGELIEEQKSDPSIKALFELVSPMEEMETAAQGYFVKDNVLVRKWCPQTDNFVGKSVVQIVVPAKFREMVMKASHDGVAGHMGVQKTYHRILCHFFWPRLKKDVSAYIKTCHTCQLTGKPNQTISPAPLYPVPNGKSKLCHVNLLKPYCARMSPSPSLKEAPSKTLLTSVVMKSFKRLVLTHLKAITDPLLDPLQFAYRANRSQHVRMGKHTLDSRTIITGSLQGCDLSPLLFSLYTKTCTSSDQNIKLLKLADDTTLIRFTLILNNLELNALKTVEMTVDFRTSPPPPITLSDSPVDTVEPFHFLGTIITQDLKWELNISSLIKRAQQRMYFLRQLKQFNLPKSMMDLRRLQRTIRSAKKVIGCNLPSLQDLYTSRNLKRAKKIATDPSHPGHKLFAVLPSGNRQKDSH